MFGSGLAVMCRDPAQPDARSGSAGQRENELLRGGADARAGSVLPVDVGRRQLPTVQIHPERGGVAVPGQPVEDLPGGLVVGGALEPEGGRDVETVDHDVAERAGTTASGR